MSSIDSDHNHFSLDPPRKTSQAPSYNSAKRSKVSAIVEQNTTSASTNGISGSTPRGDSPDPHDFYRRHQDQYRTMLGEGSGQGDIRVQQSHGGTAGRVNVPKLSLSSRVSSRYNTSPTNRSPLSAAKSSPTLSNTVRNRQTSLKELVNRFNQTPDEALPLPRKSASRSPSASPHTIRAPTSSLSNRSGIPSASKGSTGPKSKKPLRPQRADQLNSSRPYASQSTTNLAETHSKRPLFGEILAMSPTHGDTGYGIPAGRQRRRGSEGSMHSPNPMFPQERDRQVSGIIPSSPSEWYLGVTPTLDEIKTEGNIPDLPPNMHRRTRSDFTGAPSRPPTSRMYGTNLSPHRDPPLSPTSTNTSKRSSQSRIPVSTRRLSTASDSGNSTQSTRTNSALGRAHMKSPTRTTAAIPKHSQYPRSPPRHSRSSTPQRSPRRSDFGTGAQRLATSPRLTAYISAPMPKKSPPLRSSRPRQPVSNASTSASRARAVERFSGSDIGNPGSKRESRPRKPPELAGVDFAARREKIQQAVTQTVREDEQRRASMALDSRPLGTQSMSNGKPNAGRHGSVPEGKPDSNHEDYQQPTEERPRTPAADTPKSERELTINTGHLSERSVLDLSMEDSPTLGTYNRFSANLDRAQERDTSHSSDVEPSSARTAGTSDSVDTFDDEPQDESRDSSRLVSHDHEALLNRIMNMRDTNPSPERIQQPAAAEETTSDKDDQESIHIMLGETPVLEKAPFKEQYDDKLRDPQSSEGPESRWSMSSWTSSTRSRDERDAPMERIDEHSPQSSEQPAHLSISTSVSQQTPQPWSPASFTSTRTARTTMDSDAYSTINRVLDHYHDPTLVSPEMMHDVQQHIFTQSPDLARQGGWDPKKVTQLYLQELARKRSKPSNTMPDHTDPQCRQRSSSLRVSEVPEKEVRDDLDEKMVDPMERSYEDGTPPGGRLDVEDGEMRPARASLNRADDWDMSPSLGGLQLVADALDSPATDDKPMLPPKDWKSYKKDLANTPDRPQLPEIEGLGLKITLVPPQRNDSPIIPPPPLPIHSPPPPPVEPSPPNGMRSPPSPSVYSKHVPSSVYPSRVPASDSPVPPLPSNEHFRQSRSVGSSSQSQDRPSVDGPSISTDSTSKNSSPSPDQKRLIRRGHIIKELVDTEHSFGQDMKVVDDIYKGTANVIIISAEDVKTLFGNSDQIVAFSTTFLDALKQASKSVYVLPKNKRWRSNRVSSATTYSETTDDQSSMNGVELSDEDKDRRTFIGEAFGHHMANMEKVYADYLKNHDAANQKLQALQKNRNIEIWLRECRQYAHDLTSAWDLDSLLVKPVQRILKYPLLLDQLLEATPENHPDFTALDVAAREMKGISMRINEMKRRADIMEQVTKTRKRKESDVRLGLSKAFGRRTEKLRQQVGLSDMIEDKGYSAVSEKFGSHFFQLQVVMRDVEMYTNDVQVFMNRFCDFALAMETHIDVGGTSYPESESRWRKFRMSTREISMTALTDHVSPQ